jgi:SAM-dependent methyltransferase
MHPHTVQLLNQLNFLFYQTTAKSFDETRARPWSGWPRLLPHLPDPAEKPLRVLDLGCGNGRFALFLYPHRPITYDGIDSSPFLLKRADYALRAAGIPHRLHLGDLLGEWPFTAVYDLVVLFGVMHHIPAFENRRRLLQAAYDRLTPGGLLVVTFWVFYEAEDLRQRIVPWSDARVPPAYRQLDLEPHDYLLDWRRDTPALRYCHYVDEAESAKLLEGMPVCASMEADQMNRYVLVRRPVGPPADAGECENPGHG